MGNNRDYGDYSTGYDPEAVEHDLQMIRQLMHGRRQLTMHLAQEIYYKIKQENILFQSETGEDFLTSLYENMTDEKIQQINRAIRIKRQRKQNRKRLLKINGQIAITMSVIVLIASIVCINWSLFMDLRTNYQTKKLLEKINTHEDISVNANEATLRADSVASADTQTIQQVEDTAATDTQNTQTESDETVVPLSSAPLIMAKFTQLYEENHDFAGWLRIPGTKIDYPVMSREGDNNYYLDKNFEGQQDKNGLLILDYRNDVTADRQNLIIYGHNMRTGVMFGTLKNYKDKSFCEEHMTIRFDTLYEECEYRVVAAMLGSVAYEDEDVFRYYDAIDINTEENFNAFKDNMMSNAIYTTDETITYGDNCLILSTCDNYKEDGRFVVIAKKIE